VAPSREINLHWLKRAIALSRNCPKTDRSFAVGAVLLDSQGQLVATGFSLELGTGWHAEEVALHKAAEQGVDVHGGTIYSSLEPCGTRLSGKCPCVHHIAAARLARVVFALKEPPLFVTGGGAAVLQQSGIEVLHLEELGPDVEEVNNHLPL
jgi:diaminohydroxyphosphoribosylaminopyrimidine deaminase / 5-amino-6-(5-phosphoribosylamino)uracil reductase